MEQLMDIFTAELIRFIGTIIGFAFTALGAWALVIYRNVMTTIEEKNGKEATKKTLDLVKEVVQASVDYVEKTGIHLEAQDKFNLAKDRAVNSLNNKGLDIDEYDIDNFIEQAVLGFKKGFAGTELVAVEAQPEE